MPPPAAGDHKGMPLPRNIEMTPPNRDQQHPSIGHVARIEVVLDNGNAVTGVGNALQASATSASPITSRNESLYSVVLKIFWNSATLPIRHVTAILGEPKPRNRTKRHGKLFCPARTPHEGHVPLTHPERRYPIWSQSIDQRIDRSEVISAAIRVHLLSMFKRSSSPDVRSRFTMDGQNVRVREYHIAVGAANSVFFSRLVVEQERRWAESVFSTKRGECDARIG